MKKAIVFIAIALTIAIASYFAFFKEKEQEQVFPDETSEIVEADKIIFAETALDTVDKIIAKISVEAAKYPTPIAVVLTDKEKLKKPTYLLDPFVINTLVTKNQKVRALAMLMNDRIVRLAYDMPVSETDAAIATLVADLGFPLELKALTQSDESVSDNVRTYYNYCRENLELQSFWEFSMAAMNEIDYIIACDPDLYMSKVQPDQWDAYNYIWELFVESSDTLGHYDPEMAMLRDILYRDAVFEGDECCDNLYKTPEMAKQGYRKTYERVKARRNNMLEN